MENIKKLQEQLRSLYNQETQKKLSERNTVEILLRLIKTGLLEVIHSIDAREYITPEHLVYEITRELEHRGGRISIVELQPLLNIDLSYIEQYIPIVVKKNDAVILHGELISKFYLDNVAQEIQESLQTNGRLFITDLARRFKLTTEFITKVIKERLNTKIKGVLDDSILYTPQLIDQYGAQIRGVLTGITTPVSLSEIISRHNFNKNIFETVINKLSSMGRIPGSIQRQNNYQLYVPNVYTHFRDAHVQKYFLSNGYIEFDKLHKLEIKSNDYMLSRFPNGIALETCFVSADAIDTLDNAILDAVKQRTYLDLSKVITAPLSYGDVTTLMQHSSLIKRVKQKKDDSFVIVADTFIVSKEFLDRTKNLIKNQAVEKVKKESMNPSGKSMVHPGPSPSVAKGSDNKKKGKNKKEKSKGTKAATQPSKSSEDELLQSLQNWHKDCPDALLKELASDLKSLVDHFAQEAHHSLFAQDNQLKTKLKMFREKFDVLYLNILLAKKSLTGLPVALRNRLDRYLLDTLCTDLFKHILEKESMQNFIVIQELSTQADCAKALQMLPKDVASVLTSLNKTLQKSVDEFLDELTKNTAKKCELYLKPLDNKASRSLLVGHQKQTLLQLEKEENPNSVFQLVVLLVYIKFCKSLICIPSGALDVLDGLLEVMKPNLPENVYGKLKDYVALLLRHKGQSNPELGETDLLPELLANLPEIRRLVSGTKDQ